MGASRAQIDSVQSLGYAGWLDAQFALPTSTARRGWLVAAGVDAQPALTQALDAIFAHADAAPFFARQLIQRPVTSNPSGACVTRVATVFNNNGSGAKGDLKAVIKAVRLDDEARSAFCKPTVELGASNQVTAFNASDFGRATTGNDGPDHGRGSMHFMLGGAVNGGRFYGTAPAVANNRPDDVGQGRLLPSTSVDQYAATLGKWFGISDSDLLTVLPNLVNLNASRRNLGFV